jgi:glycosyltransferase involved in cell wall biosynthesis
MPFVSEQITCPTPKVSVSMITYNHAPFIHQALDSVLMQQTNFPIEICLGEDQSTDGTRGICQEYAAKYPGIIRLFLRDRSDLSRLKYKVPFMQNGIETLKACRGQYIALLEGDDYWTDPLKLQKQADLLNVDPSKSICFHGVKQVWEDGSHAPLILEPPDKRSVYSLEDILRQNIIPTCSVLFRRGLFGEVPHWYSLLEQGDWPLHILNAQYGDIGYIGEIMSVYRIHAGGVWSLQDRVLDCKKRLLALENFRNNLDHKYHRAIAAGEDKVHYELARNYVWRRQRNMAKPHITKCLLHYRRLGDVSLSQLMQIWLKVYAPTLSNPVGAARRLLCMLRRIAAGVLKRIVGLAGRSIVHHTDHEK